MQGRLHSDCHNLSSQLVVWTQVLNKIFATIQPLYMLESRQWTILSSIFIWRVLLSLLVYTNLMFYVSLLLCSYFIAVLLILMAILLWCLKRCFRDHFCALCKIKIYSREESNHIVFFSSLSWFIIILTLRVTSLVKVFVYYFTFPLSHTIIFFSYIS